jgi:transposase InsO family protein
MLSLIGVRSSTFYAWTNRTGEENNHLATSPKEHWVLDWEKKAIIAYAKKHPAEGYRRLTYMMMDENIVAVSPSTTYRVLKAAGLLNRWKTVKKNLKGHGFVQPVRIHEHRHVDIKYVNFKGTFLFLISIIDGHSRFIVHHELRQNMLEKDVQITIHRALEKYPGTSPRIISDNGSQFISKDFARFLKFTGLEHIRTSVAYPQSNGKTCPSGRRVERFHRSLSEECLRVESMIDLEDARRQIHKYIDFYNTKRLHSSLYYLTPEDFLLDRVKERLGAREDKLQQAKLARKARTDAA